MKQQTKTATDHYQADLADGFHKYVDGLIREEWIEIVSRIPNLSTANILDVGCGSGLYTRYLRNVTTGEVCGVDFSEDMLQIAEKEQENASSKIMYKNADITTDISKAIGCNPMHFDVVNCCWVFVHAQNQTILRQMIRNIYDILKEGGVFVGITQNTELTPQDIKKLEEYGAFYGRENPEAPLKDGELIHIKFYGEGNKEVMWEGDDYHYSRETYTKAFLEAGFSGVEFIPYRCAKVITGNNQLDDATPDGMNLIAYK